VAKALNGMNRLPNFFTRLFEKTGSLITRNGEDDDLIEPQGCSSMYYKFLTLSPTNQTSTISTISNTISLTITSNTAPTVSTLSSISPIVSTTISPTVSTSNAIISTLSTSSVVSTTSPTVSTTPISTSSVQRQN